MTKNWQLIAEGHGLLVPPADLDKIVSSLNALEEIFQPLVATIPLETEPAITLSEDVVISRSEAK